jgi:hypothetical protein
MSALPDRLLSGFLWQFFGGMAVNFQIAGIALAIGLVAGFILAHARLIGGLAGALSTSLVGLMRAAPTFVVMFFLLNTISRDATLWGYPVAPTGFMAVVLSLVPYSAAYVADNAFDALKHWRAGSPLGALLFLPNATRAFFVLVMSSSAGAAIGVTEAISVILREAEQLGSLGDKMILFAVGIACFAVPLQIGFACVAALQRHLGAIAVRARSASTD